MKFFTMQQCVWCAVNINPSTQGH